MLAGNGTYLGWRDHRLVIVRGRSAVAGQGKLPRQIRQGGCSGIVVNSCFRIHDIQGLSQIALREQVATEATNIGHLQRESLGQLTSEGKIDGVGMWGLQRVVGSPQVGLGVSSRCLWPARRRRRQEKWNAVQVVLRDCVNTRDPRQVLRARDAKRAASILNGGGQSGGPYLVEAVQKGESRPVVNSAKASADNGFVVISSSTGRPRRAASRLLRFAATNPSFRADRSPDRGWHGRIDPDPARIQVLELCGSKGGGPAVYVYILKDTLAERRRRNDALGALLLTLAGLRYCTWRESSSSVFCPCLSWLNHPHGKFL
jgi:hypothetical protein